MDNTDADPPTREPGTHGRRTFLRSIFAAVAVAVPAIATLTAPARALAEDDHDHCEKFYVSMGDKECIAKRYQVTWVKRCSVCGGYCGSWTTDEGPC